MYTLLYVIPDVGMEYPKVSKSRISRDYVIGNCFLHLLKFLLPPHQKLLEKAIWAYFAGHQTNWPKPVSDLFLIIKIENNEFNIMRC